MVKNITFKTRSNVTHTGNVNTNTLTICLIL